MSHKRTMPRVCRRCSVNFLADPAEAKAGRALYCSSACVHARPAVPATISADGLTALVPVFAGDGSIRAYATVDIDDLAIANRRRWRLNHKGYAQTKGKIDGQARTITLHREILGLVHGDGLDGDHIDRNRLNCRRSNLRILSDGKNAQNRTSNRGSSSSFRGVSWAARQGKWKATVRSNGRDIHLGYFVDESAAADAARSARALVMPYAVD